MHKKINKNWFFTDSKGRSHAVDLPYDAMIHEERTSDCINGINSGFFPGGKYRYEKELLFNTEDLDKKVFLHFECVYRNCVISLNGKKLYEHRYGFTCFDVDLSEAVIAGNNKLIVEVDNSLEPNCRWYSGSGIFRDVVLYVVDKDHINRLKVETVSYEPAVIRINAETVGNSKLSVEIYDGDELIANGPIGEYSIGDAKLWDEDHPFLYRIHVYSDKDDRWISYGIRKLDWNPEKGLLVNGRTVLLRGGCIHHDHGIIGANEYYDSEYRRIRTLKENGFNAVRMAHNPASQIQLDICDRLGMYVMNELCDGWYMPKTYHDYSRDFHEYWKEDMRAMVASSYNHPSVIMYSIGNEVSETYNDQGCRVCKEMTEFLHAVDETRPVTAGINVLLNVYARLGMGVYKEKGEYKPEPIKKGKEYKDQVTGSAFFNAMAQKLGNLLFFMSKGRKGDRASKGAADGLDILGLNYASSRYDEDVKKYPERMMVGSETMVNDLPYNWERVKRYPQLIGDFVWSAWDYLGEACIGDWTYPSYKGLPLLAGQGMIDITGKTLASMYFMQIVWGLRKEPYIGVSPLNHSDEIPHKGSWQFTNSLDSWSWQGYEGKKTQVEVFASGETVSLYLNDEPIGTKKVRKYKAYFKVRYQPGELKAIVKDKNGDIISESSLVSASTDTIINVSLSKDRLSLVSDELSYIRIEFTDRNGILKPYIEDSVRVDVDDHLELLGFGSALCKSDERFDDEVHKSYRGSCLAIVKGKKEGKATITINCDGYDTVVKRIEVKE